VSTLGSASCDLDECDASALDELSMIIGMPVRDADGHRIATILDVRTAPTSGGTPLFVVRLRGWRCAKQLVSADDARWHPQGGWIVPGLCRGATRGRGTTTS